MASKRIHSDTSMTAQWTCLSRAASFLERDACYRCEDWVALRLVPFSIKYLLYVPVMRKIFTRLMAPRGIYEYTIARTRYIDGVFKEALACGCGQVLILGAGFDSRALRFQDQGVNVKIFELDAPVTQQAKLGQYARRGLHVPDNVTFIAIDFDTERLPDKLDQAGFARGLKSLFILEGLLMYLQPESVDETFGVMRAFAGPGSLAVFDYVLASVLRGEGNCYGQEKMVASVAKAGESWHFGIEKGGVERFLQDRGFILGDHLDAPVLERMYFTPPSGKPVGRVNATHCLVRAIRA